MCALPNESWLWNRGMNRNLTAIICCGFASLAVLLFIVTRSRDPQLPAGIYVKGSDYEGVIVNDPRLPTNTAVSYGLWSISPDDVANLERCLQPFVKTSHFFGPRIPEVLHSYVRRYEGVTVDGRKCIYVYAVESRFWPKDKVLRADGSFALVGGGDSVWQVMFDTESGVFSGLVFNY